MPKTKHSTNPQNLTWLSLRWRFVIVKFFRFWRGVSWEKCRRTKRASPKEFAFLGRVYISGERGVAVAAISFPSFFFCFFRQWLIAHMELPFALCVRHSALCDLSVSRGPSSRKHACFSAGTIDAHVRD